MGGHPPHNKVHGGGVPGPGGASFEGADPAEAVRREVVEHLVINDKVGGWF